MSGIDFVSDRPAPDGQRIHAQMRLDVEWMLINGWELERKPDGVHLSHLGQKKIVRGGVILNG